MSGQIMSFLNAKIANAEFDIEMALSEILTDLVKKVPKLSIQNLRIGKFHDEDGEYYKVKIITKIK